LKSIQSRQIREFLSKPTFSEQVILKKDSLWPKISIITPSFNQGQFLEKTMLSVLNQNYPNLEYIVIDGGSNDDSLEIIKKYEKYLAYWVCEKDNGQSDAINKGLRIATGDLVGWQNSDDIYTQGSFRKIGSTIIAMGLADMIFGNIYVMDKNYEIKREVRYIPTKYECLFYIKASIPNQACFWRRELLNSSGYIDPSLVYCLDLDLWVRLTRNIKTRHIREFLGAYVFHGETKTAMLDSIHRRERQLIIEKYGFPSRGIRCFLKRITCVLRKIFGHIYRGEIIYLGSLLHRRIGKRGSWTS
jgi:glycosyltransferase involved in cell wall biosynthesis